jgi:N-acetylmuramoyl-L-alanine amidase
MPMKNISLITVHYSATYGDQNTTAADIDRMHRQRGWSGIGYHWFIRRDGTVERGRPESQVGAHVGGRNSGNIGVCWAGGLDRATGPNKGVDNRTPAQRAALVTVIRDVLSRHPRARVVGHRRGSP